MKEIEIDTWNRKGIYNAFRDLDFPFYHVSFRVDVTRLKAYTKTHGLSFYYSLVYLVARAADSVENFRLRFIDGRIYDMGETIPSFTFLPPGSEAFQIVSCRLTPTLEAFSAKVRELIENQQVFIGGEDVPEQALLYISCLPWFDMLSSSSERRLDPDDAIPRITWGKYVREPDGRLTLGMSVDVNHKLIDGYHIGKFYEALQGGIEGLNA